MIYLFTIAISSIFIAMRVNQIYKLFANRSQQLIPNRKFKRYEKS